MKALSLIKTFTLVVFLVAGHIAKAQETAKPKIDASKVTARSTCSLYSNVEECDAIKGDIAAKDSREKDAQAECKEDKRKYDELAAKSTMACGAFEKTRSSGNKKNNCAKNVANCRQKLDSMANPMSPSTVSSDGKSSSDMLYQIAMAGIQSNLGVAPAAATGVVSCVKDPDAKERKQALKDKNKEIKDLERDIKKESDEQAKLLEKQRDKLDEIKKKVNEVEADFKKELLKKDAKEREQTNEINKASIDAAKKLRQYGTAIVKEQQTLAKERLNYQKAMLDLTSEKVSARCKQEFEALKQGIVNIKIGDPSNTTAEKQQLEALAKQYKGKATGTAQLINLLNMAKKTCFEKANSQIADANLASGQNIQTINGRIEELNQSIKDEKLTAENNKAAIEAVKKGMSDEKLAEEKEKLDKLTSLNEEVINFQTSTEEKLKISKAQAAKLQDDIRKLKLSTDFDVVTAFDEAENFIESAERARSMAYASCNCDTASKADRACSILKADEYKKASPDRKKDESSAN